MQKSQDKREISRQQDPKGRKTPQSPSPDTAVQAHMWRPQPPQFPEMLGCVPSVQLTLGNRKGTGPGSQADLSPPNSAPLLPWAPCNLSFFISQWKLQLLPAGQLEYIKQYLRKTANTISSQSVYWASMPPPNVTTSFQTAHQLDRLAVAVYGDSDFTLFFAISTSAQLLSLDRNGKAKGPCS